MNPKIGKMFLDSGAHTLYTESVLKKGLKLAAGDDTRFEKFGFYETEEFWDYVDGYGRFLKEYGDRIDYYVNVDVIFNPELSWKVQKYLEKTYGVNPIPVIHWGTDEKWIKRHLKEGYEYIGLGGLGQEVSWRTYAKWGDRIFRLICDGKGRPKVQTHGFAMTSFVLMYRYPWTSVDSASWIKLAGYGKIYIPRKRNGKFVFDLRSSRDMPYIVSTSSESPSRRIRDESSGCLLDGGISVAKLKESKHKGRMHLSWYNKGEGTMKTIEEWFERIGVEVGDEQDPNSGGVVNRNWARCKANLSLFNEIERHLNENPVVFRRSKGLGVE